MSLVVVGLCIGNSMFSSGAARAPPFFNLLLKILLKNDVRRSKKKKKCMYKAREKSPEIKVTIVYPQTLVLVRELFLLGSIPYGTCGQSRQPILSL